MDNILNIHQASAKNNRNICNIVLKIHVSLKNKKVLIKFSFNFQFIFVYQKNLYLLTYFKKHNACLVK